LNRGYWSLAHCRIVLRDSRFPCASDTRPPLSRRWYGLRRLLHRLCHSCWRRSRGRSGRGLLPGSRGNAGSRRFPGGRN